MQSKEGDGSLTDFLPPLQRIQLFGPEMVGYGVTVLGLVCLYTNLLSSSIKFKSPVGRPQIKSKQAELSTNSTFLHSIPSETYSSWKLQNYEYYNELYKTKWNLKSQTIRQEPVSKNPLMLLERAP